LIVAGAQPAKKDRSGLAAFAGRSNLLLRVITSLVLAPLAIAVAYWGGLVFHCFWSIAALVVLWEWETLVCEHDRNPVLTIGAVALIGSSLLLAFDWEGTAVVLVGLGLFGVATLASSVRRGWCAAGLVYASVLMIAPVVLRDDAALGFAAILFLFTVVWLTDIAAYFIGRKVGGPKLLPRVSPNKTWSGAIGGTLAGVIGGVLVARLFGVANLAAVGLIALMLSIVAQVGDLLESAIKRQFGAKDASGLIPGHGGLMDRLDGFLTAAVAAALIGLVRGGFDAPARGLMVW
jgi:phosphatidate cytidylyltransferase